MKIVVCVANLVGRNLALFLTKNNHKIEFAITCKDDPYEQEIYKILSSNGVICYREIDSNSNFFIDKFLQLNIIIYQILFRYKNH